MKQHIISLLVFMLVGCASDYVPLDTVNHVNIQRYMGKWYEIASFPTWFQKDCTGTTAEYSLKPDGKVSVLNRCFKLSLSGEEDQANGTAYVVDTTTNAKLKVSFFWPFSGDYWIIELADDYSYAVVGHPNREYLWILSRSPVMSQQTYDMLLEKVKAKGFDVSKLNKTLQPKQSKV